MLEELLKYFTLDNGLFLILSFLGMWSHAIKRYLTGQLSGSVSDYVFRNNKKRTVLAIMTTIGTTAGIALGDQIPTQIGAFIMLAFTTGYTVDSSVNKDEPV